MGGPPNVLDVPCASLCFDWLCEFLVGAFPMHSHEDLVLEPFAIHLVLAQIIELVADAFICIFDTLNTIIPIFDRCKGWLNYWLFRRYIFGYFDALN